MKKNISKLICCLAAALVLAACGNAAEMGEEAADGGDSSAALVPMLPNDVSDMNVVWGFLRHAFPNSGQADEEIKYFISSVNVALGFAADGVWIHGALKNGGSATFFMRFVGANPETEIRGENPVIGKFNFIGRDDAQNVAGEEVAYKMISYGELWPGVDARFSMENGKLEYRFDVGPDGDEGAINFEYEGPDEYLNNAGAESAGIGLKGGIPGPPPSDTGLDFSIFVGGSGEEEGPSLAVMEDESVFLCGRTVSPDFPLTPGAFDSSFDPAGQIFVAKISPDGEDIEYSTFFGAVDRSRRPLISVDRAGRAYVVADYLRDAHIKVLSADGARLEHESSLGGSGENHSSDTYMDSHGHLYIAGATNSRDFPVSGNAFLPRIHAASGDSFSGYLVKLNLFGADESCDGRICYSTYLASPVSVLMNNAGGVFAKDSGIAYVTGSTQDFDFPTTADAVWRDFWPYARSQAFVVEIDTNGPSARCPDTLCYGTFLGGSGYESGMAVTSDDSGWIYAVIYTTSEDLPVTEDALDTVIESSYQPSEAAVVKIRGSELNYLTYLGGEGADIPCRGIALDEAGNVYLAGLTSSPDFPVTAGAHDQVLGGDHPGDNPLDGFVSVISPTGERLMYSTYIGDDAREYTSAMARHSSGALYVAGTSDRDGPGGDIDIFLTRFDFSSIPEMGEGPAESNQCQFIGISFGGSVVTVLDHDSDGLIDQYVCGGGEPVDLAHGAVVFDCGVRFANGTRDNDEGAGAIEMDRGSDPHTPSIIAGGPGNDDLDGSTSGDIICAGAGDDDPDGRGGDDIIYCGSGNDMCEGQEGDDQIDGAEGDDVILGLEGDDILSGGEGNDSLNGGDGDDHLFGEDGNDRLDGHYGNDTLEGGDGMDRLLGKEGNDRIFGGDGSDFILADEGDDYVEAGDSDDYVKGGDGNDTIHGNGGLDIVYASDGDDVIYGDEERDVLYGEDGADIIMGGEGGDLIYGKNGNDRIDGGSGDDNLSGGNGDDDIEGGEGNDDITGQHGNNVLIGGGGNDNIRGAGGADCIDGGDGEDHLEGGSGDDRIIGGYGVDTIIGGDGNDLLSAFDGGMDMVMGRGGADIAYIDPDDRSDMAIEMRFERRGPQSCRN